MKCKLMAPSKTRFRESNRTHPDSMYEAYNSYHVELWGRPWPLLQSAQNLDRVAIALIVIWSMAHSHYLVKPLHYLNLLTLLAFTYQGRT